MLPTSRYQTPLSLFLARAAPFSCLHPLRKALLHHYDPAQRHGHPHPEETE